MYKTILFDLDGTLTESGEGIMKSVQYALEKIGKREDNLDNLRVFIGPPLLEQFISYASIDKETAKLCVKYFRERFSTKGIFENKLYPNVEYVLKTLKDKGYLLAVSSSKPEFFVLQILEYFNIKKYFDEVVGSTLDEKRTAKSEVIYETLNRMNLLNNREYVLMVGDRKHDIIGANSQDIDCLAVSYGYGSISELKNSKPLEIINSIDEILEIL